MNNRIRTALAAAVIGAAGSWTIPAQGQTLSHPVPGPCTPAGELHFVCGLHQPEDLALIPGTHWIVTTGMETDGLGGMFLVDTEAKSAHKLDFGKEIAVHPDQKTYPQCTTPPDSSKFSTQGLNLRSEGGKKYRLNVVGHGARDSIEVFDVDASKAVPAVSWRGCVALAPGGNSVTSAKDGTLYATIFVRKGSSFPQMLAGKDTGDVYVWHPGSAAFEKLPGLSLSGPNGIEISKDEKTLYIAFTGTRDMISVAISDPSHPVQRADFAALDFAPDNIHWTGDGQLIAAGMREMEPDCGSLSQRDAASHPEYANCHRAPVVALIDPTSFKEHVAFTGDKADQRYNGTSTGLLINGTLWMGSFGSDRVAYVELTDQQKAAFRPQR